MIKIVKKLSLLRIEALEWYPRGAVEIVEDKTDVNYQNDFIKDYEAYSVNQIKASENEKWIKPKKVYSKTLIHRPKT